MKKSFFITGTDTGVGKTTVAAGLASAFRKKGLAVGVMKPVETGCVEKDGALVPADAIRLKEASGCKEPLDIINPYRFAPPVAPNVAARGAGVEIDLEVIVSCLSTLTNSYDVVIVEGAGGLMSPVTDTETMADLARYLTTPIVIVAPSRLGVINHTLLTALAARTTGVQVAGVILNHPAPGDTGPENNLEEIERFTGIRVLGEIAYKKNGAPDLRDAAQRLLGGTFLQKSSPQGFL